MEDMQELIVVDTKNIKPGKDSLVCNIKSYPIEPTY
jgi:hypothetical protein